MSVADCPKWRPGCRRCVGRPVWDIDFGVRRALGIRAPRRGAFVPAGNETFNRLSDKGVMSMALLVVRV